MPRLTQRPTRPHAALDRDRRIERRRARENRARDRQEIETLDWRSLLDEDVPLKQDHRHAR